MTFKRKGNIRDKLVFAKLYARPVELCVSVIDEDDPSCSRQVVVTMKKIDDSGIRLGVI